MRILSSTVLAAAALIGTASAQNGSGEIVIRDYFGTVEIRFSEGGAIDVVQTRSDDDLSIEKRRGGAMIDGGDRINKKRWHRSYRDERKRGDSGARGEDRTFERMLENRPSLVVTAPSGTGVRVEDSAVRLTASGAAGAVEIDDNVHLLVEMGDVGPSELSVHGHGYIGVKNVAGPLEASVHGSGDIVFLSAERADLSVHGSGDLEGQSVAGHLDASVHGSGDLKIEVVEGMTEASVHGSGDLELGRLARGLDGSVHGSGDLKADEVSGDLEASIHGSGDMAVMGGSVASLIADVRGSGSFRFEGKAREADLTSRGSGNITVGRVEGNVRTSGKNIRINGNRAGRDTR